MSPQYGETTLPALKLVQSSLTARRLANGLVALLVLAIVAMAFLPWQQSARGTGRVVACRAVCRLAFGSRGDVWRASRLDRCDRRRYRAVSFAVDAGTLGSVAFQPIPAARRPSERLGHAQSRIIGLRNLAATERIPAGARKGPDGSRRREGRQETSCPSDAGDMPGMASFFVTQILSGPTRATVAAGGGDWLKANAANPRRLGPCCRV